MIARLPDFVIIGAMKSATSTLHSQLALQPGIFMSSPKEPNFFSDAGQWARGLDWYRGLFADAAPDNLCGESSTHYTKLPDLPDALPRLRAHLPEAKLIYVMRHPIDRLISHYSHGWLERSIDGPIDLAVDRYPALTDYGRYAMQIAPWLDAFGPDAVLPVFFDRLIRAPGATLDNICAFLDYRGTPVWHDIEAQNVSVSRLRDSRWRDALIDDPLITILRRKFIPQAWRDRIKRRWQMPARPVLAGRALARVTATFDADLAMLGKMLGVPLSCATFKETTANQTLEWVKTQPRNGEELVVSPSDRPTCP